MTEPSTGTGSPADPLVDRRWFEEALRSQGFVVEPPAVDLEPRTSAVPEGEAAEERPIDGQPAKERPPVPSDLLARIASRGQASASDEPPGMDLAPAPTAEPTVGRQPPVDVPSFAPAPTASAPVDVVTPRWAEAIVATDAPWSTSVADETDPGSLDRPTEDAPTLVAPPSPPVEPRADVASPVAVDALAAPDAQEDAHQQAPTSVASAAIEAPLTSSGPESSEGELWALVGGAEASAAERSGSALVRVLLTILAALVILVIVVGSLVLASQLA